MNKFFAAGLLTLMVGAATVAPSMAHPPYGHGPHHPGMMMRHNDDRTDIRRQEVLVNQLQARVDRDRQFKRTKTAMYTRNLADLRAAQAKLKAMEVRYHR